MRNVFLGIVTVAVVLIVGVAYYVSRKENADGLRLQEESEEKEETAADSADSTGGETGIDSDDAVQVQTVVVFVCGQVATEGVYELRIDARVEDCITAAGGFTANACRTYLNLAEHIEDGMKLYVPSIEEVENLSDTGWITEEENSLVNINRADVEQLTELTGIGETRATAIVAFREENGAFTSITDIMKVPGIKEATFEMFKDQICVN